MVSVDVEVSSACLVIKADVEVTVVVLKSCAAVCVGAGSDNADAKVVI